jgi:hypothetical protein
MPIGRDACGSLRLVPKGERSMNVKQLKEKRALILSEAEAFKGADGSFKDDATRTAFDAKMAEIETLDAQIRAAEAAKPAGDKTADQVREEAVAAERARSEGIRDAVRIAKLEGSVAEDLVKRGVTIEAARAEIFAKMKATSDENPTRSGIVFGEDVRDKWMRGMTNWLLVRTGSAKDVAKHENVDVRTIDPGEFRGFSLTDIARDVLEHHGQATRGLSKMDLIGRAFMLRGGDIYQTTSDFTTLLENVLHKTLQAAYAITPDTWTRFCNTSTVVDFRAHNRYRMGNFGSLDALSEVGEFKTKAINDAEKATITATTKGNIINVSRQMIVNDDLGFFTQLTGRLGRAAKLSVEVDVYALLALNSGDGPTMSDSNNLFSAAHGNKTTGAAITAAAIDLDRIAMAKQKEPNGNDYIDLRPAILVIAVELGGQARAINQSQYDPDNIANKAQMRPNVVVGLFRDVVDSPRVSAISATRRYLFADPSLAPVIEVAYLEGQTTPVLETQDGWRVDGAEMKVRFDYGVAAVDYRGAVSNPGV